MKTTRLLAMIALFAIILSSFFNAVVYWQWGNWWWSWWSTTSGWSTSSWWDNWWTSWWSTSTWWDNSGSDSTWWWDTWWDSSGSDSTWNNTWWDSSGSSNTWNSSTWWDNSWPESNWNWDTGWNWNWNSDNSWNWWNSGWNNGNSPWQWDLVRNMYWEVTQLKARVNNESQELANRIMNRVIKAYWDWSSSWNTLQTRDRYQDFLRSLDTINLNESLEEQIGDSFDYLKDRVRFRIRLLAEQADCEWDMTQSQLQTSNAIMNKLSTQAQNKTKQEGVEQYRQFLWNIEQIKEMLWQLNSDDANYEQLKKMLEHMEIKAYWRLEALENE